MDTALKSADERDHAPKRPVISQQMVHIDLRDERIQEALGRICEVVSSEYADAEYVSYIGLNPLGVYLEVYTEANDFDGILKVVSEQLGDLSVASGVNVCVAPQKKRVQRAA
jgi:hypothetical protein